MRVLGLQGYQPYKPAVGDYVSLTGISGLATVEGSYARIVRVADHTELVAIRPNGPPVALEVHATGSSQITCCWRGVPGATGHNIYRGTTSGGEDYRNPVNGATLWNTPSYPGSETFAFTNTGLTTGTEYFYTVKAVRTYGESAPSEEDSDIPVAGAIPWDTRNAYAITSAVASLAGVTGDVIRVVGPDNTTYCSMSGVLLPQAALLPGTNVLHYPDGTEAALPADGGPVGQEEGIGEQTEPIPATWGNESDGPYRGVRTRALYTGCRGYFHPGWYGTIDLSDYFPKDTYYTYLGSRREKYVGPKLVSAVDIDAGLQWSRRYRVFNPWISVEYQRLDSTVFRWLGLEDLQVRFDNQFGHSIEMQYVIHQVGSTLSHVASLVVEGMDQYAQFASVVLAASEPMKAGAPMMKRCHSIAQGKPPNRWRRTGPHFYGASFYGGQVLEPGHPWAPWPGDADHIESQSEYPLSPSYVVNYTVPSGKEYYEEHDIECDAR